MRIDVAVDAAEFLFWETLVLFLRPSADGMRPTCIIEGNFFCLKPIDSKR